MAQYLKEKEETMVYKNIKDVTLKAEREENGPITRKYMDNICTSNMDNFTKVITTIHMKAQDK